MSRKTDAQWKKGQSGNPGGITSEERKAYIAYRRSLARLQPDAINAVKKNLKEDAKWVLEQLHGKAKQQTEITGEGGGALEIVFQEKVQVA